MTSWFGIVCFQTNHNKPLSIVTTGKQSALNSRARDVMLYGLQRFWVYMTMIRTRTKCRETRTLTTVMDLGLESVASGYWAAVVQTVLPGRMLLSHAVGPSFRPRTQHRVPGFFLISYALFNLFQFTGLFCVLQEWYAKWAKHNTTHFKKTPWSQLISHCVVSKCLWKLKRINFALAQS